MVSKNNNNKVDIYRRVYLLEENFYVHVTSVPRLTFLNASDAHLLHR